MITTEVLFSSLVDVFAAWKDLLARKVRSACCIARQKVGVIVEASYVWSRVREMV
jgi:hypothetical protein